MESTGQSLWQRYTAALYDHPVRTLTGAGLLFMLLGWWQDGLNLDSATYAVIARHMAEHGTWFDPHYTAFHHQHFAEHPPLVMWLQGIIFFLLGASDATARITGQLAAVGSVVMVFLIGRDAGRGGEATAFGLLSGLVLLLTYNFMQISNSTLLDVPMTFFILLTLWLLAGAQRQSDPSPWLFAFLGAALAGAFLAKGVVAGPVFAAVAAAVVFMNPGWLKKGRFWLFPVTLVIFLGVYFFLDEIYAGGHFRRHYFLVQVWRRFQGGGPEIDTDWWQFTFRYIRLYLPFALLVPFGLYFLASRRLKLLYPLVVTFVFYFVLYSSAAKIYYHYFSPVYALSALLVALPLAIWLRPRIVRHVLGVFVLVWALAAIGVSAAGVRVHPVRMPEIYELTDQMTARLADQRARDGLLVRAPEPHWDIVAKTGWYWRSDIKTLPSVAAAVGTLTAEPRFSYLITLSEDDMNAALADDAGLRILARRGRLAVLVPSDPN